MIIEELIAAIFYVSSGRFFVFINSFMLFPLLSGRSRYRLNAYKYRIWYQTPLCSDPRYINITHLSAESEHGCSSIDFPFAFSSTNNWIKSAIATGSNPKRVHRQYKDWIHGANKSWPFASSLLKAIWGTNPFSAKRNRSNKGWTRSMTWLPALNHVSYGLDMLSQVNSSYRLTGVSGITNFLAVFVGASGKQANQSMLPNIGCNRPIISLIWLTSQLHLVQSNNQLAIRNWRNSPLSG